MLNKSSDEAKIAAGICPTCETDGRTMETAFDANCPAEWAHKFISKFARVSSPLAQRGAGSTGGAPTEEAVVRKMVANISDHYLAKLSCGSRRLSAEDGICHPREEHERVMVATFCGFLGFDVKDK